MSEIRFDRDVIAKVFPDPRSRRSFELLLSDLATASEGASLAVAETAKLNEAAFVTLSANAELPNERVLQFLPDGGIGATVTDNSVTLALTSHAVKSEGGFRIALVGTGDAMLGAPLSGMLATEEWVNAQGFSTGGGSGTVTSVSGTGTVSGLTLTGTVTTSGSLTLGGTLSVTASNFASQTANTFLAAPNGSAGVPTFRPIVAADIPTLNQNTTGSAATLTTARDITMTGDVAWTVSFNGSANVSAGGTIANDAVTNAKLANMATATFKGRTTAGTGDPEDLSTAQATALLDTFTSSLKGLAPASGGGTTNFLRADGTWAAPGGGGGSGDVVGPASATDNALARYDSTTGKLLQDSRVRADDDGRVTTWTNSNANEGVVPSEHWIRLASDYTLTSSVAEQKLFNATTNGRLTLPVGTYFFDCLLYLTTMSATSGNMAFDPIGGGSAVGSSFLYHTVGIDNTTPANAGTQTGSFTATQQTVASAVTAGTGTGMGARITGTLRITTAGTIVPSGTLVTANAAVVKAGSYFRIWRAADQTTNFVGQWD